MPGDRAAVRWCALGALQAAARCRRAEEGIRPGSLDGIIGAPSAVREVTGGPGLREVGARLDHAAILGVLDGAVGRASAPRG